MQAISSSGHRQQATGILRSARCAAQRTSRAAAAATELQLKLHRGIGVGVGVGVGPVVAQITRTQLG